MAKQIKLYKLIILYMLNKVDFPLTTSQISEFILTEGYTDYFKLQQAVSELSEDGFLAIESTHNRTFYHLTEEGAQTLDFFKNDISGAIQSDIDNYLSQKKYELKDEFNVKADFHQNEKQEYVVELKVIEHDEPLIALALNVPTKSEAETIAHNWTRKNQEIYAMLMAQLL